MRNCLLPAALALLCLPGCVLHHTWSEPDAQRFAGAWETPGLDRQAVRLEFWTEGECDAPRLYHDARRILLDSGKFRPVNAKAKAPLHVEMTVRVSRQTHAWKTALNALLLYAWPITAQDYRCEVFVDLRDPTGRLLGHVYTQGRGRSTLWLGYALWPRWLFNGDRADVIHRDALRAATVQMCDALMTKAKK